MRANASFLDDNQEQRAKYECFSVLITVSVRKTRANQVVCVFGVLFRNHGENLSESFIMSLFVRSTDWYSVLVLKMSWSVSTGAHK